MANSDIKVTFSDGNIKRIGSSDCSCPNVVKIIISSLVIGKKYTVFSTNLNNANVRLFPESYSFIADSINKTLSFYYQFNWYYITELSIDLQEYTRN